MDWKEVYAESFGLQPHLEVVKRETIEYGREGKTICKICKNEIPAKEKQVKILVKPKNWIDNVYAVGGFYYRVCINCDSKIEKLPYRLKINLT